MKILKVDTWLPIFSGFYGTIWEAENDEEMEVFNINEARREKGLPDVDVDAIEWDYDGYNKAVCEGVTESVGDALVRGGFIKGYKFQKLASPRQYNFTNDHINVAFTLDQTNRRTIADYLNRHSEAFATYLKRYQSCDGFISFHSSRIEDWLTDLNATLGDTHKLGAVLDFILRNEDKDMEGSIYEDLNGNGVYLTASNYAALAGDK